MVGLNLSIRGRLCLGFAIVLSMLVVLSAFSISRVQNIVRNLSVMNDINSVKQRYAINFRGSVHDRAIALRDVSLAVTPGEAQVASDNIERLGSNYAKSAAPLDAMMASGQQVTDEEQSILGSIKATEAKTLPIIADVLQKKRSGDEAGAKAVLMGSAKPLFVEWLKEINQFIDLEEAKNKAIGANARAIAESFFLYTVLLATAALALGSVVAIWAVRGLNPLKRLTSVIGRLAAGDFTAEVPDVERKDEVGAIAQAVQVFKSTGIERVRLELQANQHKQEIDTKLREVQAAFESAGRNQKAIVEDLATCLGQLAAKDLTISLNHDTAPEYARLKQDFNSAVLSLRETMTSVLSSSSSLDVGSAEISMACDDLSRRTEQQAASLAETSAALAEITNTVRRTAEGAHHAREVVDIARVGATKSGEIVAQAVAAMGEIERSAHEISQIISVIDEIAFQTNLLALNAGVEAARAGDAGRGFAVVASEVRALAQRSAEAAREIKALISTSSAQVKQGVYLVGETGTALTQIVTQVAEINGIVGGIAASAQEQAAGLDQVNTAVSQMDHVTQQNAAMVEQTTAASHAFATEVLGLTRLVSQFEIGPDAIRHRDGMRPAIALAKRSTKKNDVLPGKSMLQPVTQKFVVNGTTGSASEASWEEF